MSVQLDGPQFYYLIHDPNNLKQYEIDLRALKRTAEEGDYLFVPSGNPYPLEEKKVQVKEWENTKQFIGKTERESGKSEIGLRLEKDLNLLSQNQKKRFFVVFRPDHMSSSENEGTPLQLQIDYLLKRFSFAKLPPSKAKFFYLVQTKGDEGQTAANKKYLQENSIQGDYLFFPDEKNPFSLEKCISKKWTSGGTLRNPDRRRSSSISRFLGMDPDVNSAKKLKKEIKKLSSEHQDVFVVFHPKHLNEENVAAKKLNKLIKEFNFEKISLSKEEEKTTTIETVPQGQIEEKITTGLEQVSLSEVNEETKAKVEDVKFYYLVHKPTDSKQTEKNRKYLEQHFNKETDLLLIPNKDPYPGFEPVKKWDEWEEPKGVKPGHGSFKAFRSDEKAKELENTLWSALNQKEKKNIFVVFLHYHVNFGGKGDETPLEMKVNQIIQDNNFNFAKVPPE